MLNPAGKMRNHTELREKTVKCLLKYVSVVGFLFAASPASAITWGEPDQEAHPNVVALLFVQNGVGFFSCTGTLLSPWVVLTAGHCTEGEGQENDLTLVRNTEHALEGIGDYPDTLSWLIAEWTFGIAVPHPEYDDYAEFPDTYDIGLILLDSPIYVTEYGTLPELGQFDYLANAKGPISQRQAAVVGYGLLGTIPAFAGDDFARYKGVSSVIGSEHGAVLGHQNLKFTNNPGKGSGSGGTCSGDSGGPAFWIDPDTGEETSIVMAVNSYGIAANCNGNDYQFRTDIEEAQDFVNFWLSNWPL